jgi:predicted transcriptional regulator YdeE
MMKKMTQARDIMIVGIALRTSNEEAMETIPPLWGRFLSEGILGQIPNRVNDEINAVYTNFENEGGASTSISV